MIAVTPTLAATIDCTKNSGSCCSATTFAHEGDHVQAQPEDVRELLDDQRQTGQPDDLGRPPGADRLQDGGDAVPEAGDDGGEPS